MLVTAIQTTFCRLFLIDWTTECNFLPTLQWINLVEVLIIEITCGSAAAIQYSELVFYIMPLATTSIVSLHLLDLSTHI